MTQMEPAPPVFHEGDEVVLVAGSYQGTLGVFVRLKSDFAWADVMERNGEVRSHPVVWLRHAVARVPGSVTTGGSLGQSND